MAFFTSGMQSVKIRKKCLNFQGIQIFSLLPFEIWLCDYAI